jgi:hypothetical protein
MHNCRDISSGNRRSIPSLVLCTFILAFVVMPCVSAIAMPATWVYRTNFVDLWNSDEPCPLGSSIYITLATDTQADVGFEDGRRSLGYKSYPLKNTARYILALDDKSLPAPYLIIDEDDRLEAWHAPTDKAPVCVYAREE